MIKIKSMIADTKMSSAMSQKIKKGDKINNRFEIIDIKKGGMSLVLISKDLKNNELVALKTIKRKDLKSRLIIDAFKKEALAWTYIGCHPYIVDAKYATFIGERPFIALEYIEYDDKGRNTLKDYIKDNPPLYLVLKWGIQLTYALEHLQNKGIYPFRDIKSENIMITKEKNIKLTDFGTAILWQNSDYIPEWDDFKINENKEIDFIENSSKLTNKVMGTAEYMAPELFDNKKAIQSDIYSVGVLLYQLVNFGFFPITAMRLDEYQYAHKNAPVKKLDHILFPIIDKCLKKRPEDRYKSYQNLRFDLESLYQSKIGDCPNLHPKNYDLDDKFECQNRFEKIYSLLELGFHHHAGNELESHVNSCPDYQDSEIWHEYMGDIEHKKGNVEKAVKEYEISIELNPNYYDVYLKLVECLEKIGNFEKAEQVNKIS
jgi:serine/threonine protein kinase